MRTFRNAIAATLVLPSLYGSGFIVGNVDRSEKSGIVIAQLPWARPKPPETKPIALDPKTTAVLVMDLSTRCDDPKQLCRRLFPAVSDFVKRARVAGVLVIYTVSLVAKGTPLGDAATPFDRAPEEPLIYPDGLDKFAGGELNAILKGRGIKTVVVTGASSNTTVLYTGTTAARSYQYEVVIPIDGTIGNGEYEQEYTFYQFSVLPGGVSKLAKFTTLAEIDFRKP